MKKVLEENKDNITDIAYKRCSEALVNIEDENLAESTWDDVARCMGYDRRTIFRIHKI